MIDNNVQGILTTQTLAGDQGGIGSLLYFSYGLEVFDLSIDQICKLVENPEMGDKGKLMLVLCR